MSTIGNLATVTSVTDEIQIPVVDVDFVTKKLTVGQIGDHVASSITRGATGATGVQGATGPAGATGAGATGATGVQGVQGSTGVRGATGVAGPRGSTGYDGSTGATGYGYPGATGATGFRGAPGATGSTGPQGSTGATAPLGTRAVPGSLSPGYTLLFDTSTAVFDLPQAIFTTSSVTLNNITASNILVQNVLTSPEVIQNTRPVIDTIDFSVAGDGLNISTATIRGPRALFTLTNFDTLSIVTNRSGGNYTTRDVRLLSPLDADSLISAGLVVSGGIGVSKSVRIGTNLYVSGIDMLSYSTSTWMVASNGNDVTGDGRRPQSAFKSIGRALQFAGPGDTIEVGPGDYTETFPMTIPQGATVKGGGIRSTTIRPTLASNTQTAFLLNGETTLSDFNVTGFYKPGYAFKFAQGAKITTKSPYLERVSVITLGSTTSSSDPYGYASGDAGNGAYIDAGVLDPTSLEPAMLWNETTFIVPNATGFYMTNGARAELLNGFFYFAETAIKAEVGTLGYGGVGKTRLKLGGTITGTFSAGQTLTYKNSAGATLASGQIASVSGDYIYLNGPIWGFQAATDRAAKTLFANGNAALSISQKKFGQSSLYTDGTGDYLNSAVYADLGFSTGDFTIEFWAYRTVTQLGTIIDFHPTAAGNYHQVNLSSTGVLRYAINGTTVITGNTLVANAWHHVAITRQGTSVKMFLDGTQVGSTYTDSTDFPTSAITIGANNLGANGYGGYLDEIRISKGTARYTGTFATATVPFVSDDSAVLMLHLNGADASVLIVDDSISVQDVSSSGGATATKIILADYHQFGAELRCIGSAAVFGNRGVVANGTGTDLKLIAFNMSHIGAAGDLSDDVSLAIQANEVIQTNGGKIYYQTVDHNGDFRVGSSFLVNQRTGNVTFGSANINLTSLQSLTITDGSVTTNVQPGSITVGNLLLANNNISTLAGDLTLDPNGVLNVNSDMNVAGVGSFNNLLYANNVLNATSTTNGSLVVAGGVGIAKDVYIGGTLYQSGSTTVAGGMTVTQELAILSVTDSTTTATGALKVNGGIGVGGNVNIKGNLQVFGTALTASNATAVFSSIQNTPVGSVTSSTGRFTTLYGNAGSLNNITIGLTGKAAGTFTNLTADTISVGGGGLNGVDVGLVTPAQGTFTNLTATGNINLRAGAAKQFVISAVATGNIDNMNIGLTTKAAGTFTTITADTLNVGGGGLNGVTVGLTTPAAGSFTTLTAQSISVGGGGLNGVSVGSVTASSGRFTTLESTDTTNSTSTTTGAVVIAGGVGIGKDVFVGGQIYGPTTATVYVTAAAGNQSINTILANYYTKAQIDDLIGYTTLPVEQDWGLIDNIDPANAVDPTRSQDWGLITDSLDYGLSEDWDRDTPTTV
jgi:hypothetical protein